jgi:AraC-like DNA-binding protein
MDAWGDGGPLHFSTDNLPEGDRTAIFREVIGRQLLRLDIEPLPDVPLQVDMTVHLLPGLAMMSGSSLGGRSARTRELVADGDDDFFFGMNFLGSTQVSQRGRDVELRNGAATFFSCAEENTIVHRNHVQFTGLKIPRAAIASRVRDVDSLTMGVISGSVGTLRLLTRYLGIISEPGTLDTPELRQLAATHLHDLIALILGATPDAAATAASRGLRAARLHAIKAYIASRLTHPDLTAAGVARRQGISESYLRKLLDSDGTSFSDFVLNARLARAHRRLTDPRLIDRTIASIAFEVGFGDLSYFNRSFRRLYGATPSDVRAAAMPRYPQ